jgi:hypothetical protein
MIIALLVHVNTRMFQHNFHKKKKEKKRKKKKKKKKKERQAKLCAYLPHHALSVVAAPPLQT